MDLPEPCMVKVHVSSRAWEPESVREVDHPILLPHQLMAVIHDKYPEQWGDCATLLVSKSFGSHDMSDPKLF